MIYNKKYDELIKELLYMADEYSESEEEENREFGTILHVIANKIVNSLELTSKEHKILEAELIDWDSKIYFTTDPEYATKETKKLWKLLMHFMAEFGMLEVYDPDAITTRKPKTIVINGVKYIVG